MSGFRLPNRKLQKKFSTHKAFVDHGNYAGNRLLPKSIILPQQQPILTNEKALPPALSRRECFHILFMRRFCLADNIRKYIPGIRNKKL